MTNDQLERVVVLETEVATLKKTNAQVLQTVLEIKGEINKYKGFIGSVWFVVSCVGIFFSTIKFFHKG